MKNKMVPNPAAPLMFALFILWGFGYDTVGARLKIRLEGVVISSRDVPSTGAPRYATEYTLRAPDGRESVYIAGATDASLPRSLPVGTTINKQRWHLDYEKNGQRVEDFGVFFYGSMMGIALACMVWSFLLWRGQGKATYSPGNLP